jgi:hypothetical protein
VLNLIRQEPLQKRRAEFCSPFFCLQFWDNLLVLFLVPLGGGKLCTAEFQGEMNL